MKVKFIFIVSMAFSSLFTLCSKVILPDPVKPEAQRTASLTRSDEHMETVNGIKVTPHEGYRHWWLYTGAQVEIAYLLESDPDIHIRIPNTSEGDLMIAPDGYYPLKVSFLRSGTYTIQAVKYTRYSRGDGGEFTILAERTITVYGDDFVRFYPYRSTKCPYDIWYSPTDYGSTYSINGDREKLIKSGNDIAKYPKCHQKPDTQRTGKAIVAERERTKLLHPGSL